MIVSSIADQYGIRIYSSEFKTMPWFEFKALMNGLSPNTPLGRIVAIRKESDKDVLKNFSNEQKRIRNEWRSRTAKNKTDEERDVFIEEMKQAFIQMAGGVEN